MVSPLNQETNKLSWGFATEGVCVRGGPHVAKADNERVKGAEKNKRVSTRTTVMQARKTTVDLAAPVNEERRIY